MSRGEVIDRNGVIDDVLGLASSWLGRAAGPYRGHVYRVFNYARRLGQGAATDDELAIASAFHDLGIWSDGTFDYLAPSASRALAYAAERRPDVDPTLLERLIMNHHKLTRLRGAGDAGAEAFRRADLVDVSRGLLRAGLDRAFVREATSSFPYAGFHGVLARTAFAWFVRHPLRPLPMLRL